MIDNLPDNNIIALNLLGITPQHVSIFMEYILSLIQHGAAKELEKVLLLSVAADRFSSSLPYFHHGKTK